MANIFNQSQYNQEMGKFKLLSSTSGVGAIATTKFNNYVLIIGHSNWGFIEKANFIIKQALEDGTEDLISKNLNRNGLIEVQDSRFIKLLKKEKQINELYVLIDLPNIEISERGNYINWEKIKGFGDHPSPIKRKIELEGIQNPLETYLIKAKHFPGWFIDRKGQLKHIKEWKQRWLDKKLKINKFAPPRDYNDVYPNSDIHKTLRQTNLLLICENGHLSDIPWSKYIEWSIKHKGEDKECKELFSYDNCCTSPDLKWSENRSRSIGFESVFIECKNCKKGGGDDYNKKVNLRGIQSLSPKCPGHKPWINDAYIAPPNNQYMPREQCNSRRGMNFVLATANNVYYANVESSLYIPNPLLNDYPDDVNKALKTILNQFEKEKEDNNISKQDFFETKDREEGNGYFIYSLGLSSENLDQSKVILKNAFCNLDENHATSDLKLAYRFQEFKVLTQNQSSVKDGLKFQSVNIKSSILFDYFKSIKKIPELKVTQVQTQFTRVKPAERILNENGEIVYSANSQTTYENDKVRVLPANQTVGEGVFFEFDENKLDECISNMGSFFKQRFDNLFNTAIKDEEQGVEIRRKIQESKYKFFIVHTFAHVLMREFEFSCGYPSASLKERLYISNDNEYKMAGVLIYTTDGAEGSMGGIISQTEPLRLSKILEDAMIRAINCSSDPLCWESEGQGVFNANLASCFSCSLVSETTCEEMNLGLDRRVLVDPQFG